MIIMDLGACTIQTAGKPRSGYEFYVRLKLDGLLLLMHSIIKHNPLNEIGLYIEDAYIRDSRGSQGYKIVGLPEITSFVFIYADNEKVRDYFSEQLESRLYLVDSLDNSVDPFLLDLTEALERIKRIEHA